MYQETEMSRATNEENKRIDASQGEPIDEENQPSHQANEVNACQCMQCIDPNNLYPLEQEHTSQEDIDEELGASLRCRKLQMAPTKTERAAHALCHIPYRSWCEVCVAGRGISTQHRVRRLHEEREVPQICMDYCFLRNSIGEESITVIVGKDKHSRGVFAHVVPQKGGDVDWVQVVRDVKKFGHYDRIIIKTDQESALTTI